MTSRPYLHKAGVNALRLRCLAWLVGVALLASCGDDMRLHTGSDADLQRSLERILQRLPTEEANALDHALRDIVVYRMSPQRPETARLSAELDVFPALPATSPRDYVVAMIGEIESDWARLRVDALRDNAAALLDRRSVPEILELAASERRRHAERTRAEAGGLLERARSRLQDAERLLAQIRVGAIPDAATLSNIVVSGHALMLRPVAGQDEAILTFTLRNSSDMRPGRIHFLATIKRGSFTPVEHRAVIAHDVPGGLQPNATQRHVMSMSGILREVLCDGVDLFGVSVDLAPVRMEDARGRRAGIADIDDLTTDRLSALRALVARIEEHHAQLSTAGGGTSDAPSAKHEAGG
jgi:hypothetical protein